jgi:hypothetical protein
MVGRCSTTCWIRGPDRSDSPENGFMVYKPADVGQKHRDDAYVLYVDESESKVEEIAFRIDANAISPELIRRICILARQLGCVLMTADYRILLPDESMVLDTIQHSTAKKFVDDPVATLRKLGQPEMQKRFKLPDEG